VEGPKDGYYSSLNTFDHDTALGAYPQPAFQSQGRLVGNTYIS